MMKSLVVAVLTAISMPLVSSAVSAQDGQAEQAGLVAVLDVAKVFKANPEFEQQMQTIKSEADTLKIEIQQKQEAIRMRAQEVSQYEMGTPERNQLEAKIEQDKPRCEHRRVRRRSRPTQSGAQNYATRLTKP